MPPRLPRKNDAASIRSRQEALGLDGAVTGVDLEPFAQRLGYRVTEAGLQRLIVERQYFNRFFAGHRAIDGTEMITGTTGKQHRRRANDNHSRQAHRSVGG